MAGQRARGRSPFLPACVCWEKMTTARMPAGAGLPGGGSGSGQNGNGRALPNRPVKRAGNINAKTASSLSSFINQ